MSENIPQEGQDLSYFQMARAGYQELVNAIIRPPRARYSKAALGPKRFRFHGKVFKRNDFELANARGMALQCSHWEPDGWRLAERLPCVVYLHGNSSARPESLPQLELVLCLGATLLAFDCSGSGLSDGDYVSLGYWERDDLDAVIEYLRASGDVGAIALWGRSMGASTALLHGDRDPSIAAMVVDSAFADLVQLAQEMVQKGRDAGLAVPGIAVKLAMRMIRSSVQRAAGFNLKDLCPIKHADRTYIPALFVAASGDEFIRPHHTQEIYEAYAGDKNIVIVEGDHNSNRPQFLHDSVYIFLQNYLRIPSEWSLVQQETNLNLDMDLDLWAGNNSYENLKTGTQSEEAFSQFVDGGEGMNPERQGEIQESLYKMLAQPRPKSEEGAKNSPPKKKLEEVLADKSSHNSRNRNRSSNSPQLRRNARMPDPDESSTKISREYFGVEIIEDYSNHGRQGGRKVEAEQDEIDKAREFCFEWACKSCTLLNEGKDQFCAVCGNERITV